MTVTVFFFDQLEKQALALGTPGHFAKTMLTEMSLYLLGQDG